MLSFILQETPDIIRRILDLQQNNWVSIKENNSKHQYLSESKMLIIKNIIEIIMKNIDFICKIQLTTEVNATNTIEKRNLKSSLFDNENSVITLWSSDMHYGTEHKQMYAEDLQLTLQFVLQYFKLDLMHDITGIEKIQQFLNICYENQDNSSGDLFLSMI